MDEDILPRLHSDCWIRPLFWMEERLALRLIYRQSLVFSYEMAIISSASSFSSFVSVSG